MRTGSLIIVVIFFVLFTAGSCSRKDRQDQFADKLNDSIPVFSTIEADWMKQGYPQQPSKWHSISAFDTLSIGDFLLSFRRTQGDFSPYYSDHYKRDSVQYGHDNDFHKSMAVERYLEEDYDSLFVRRGDTLQFLIGSGRHWQLINSDSQRYCLEHLFEAQSLFLVKVYYQIGNSYLLMDADNGEVTYLWGRPYFSPEGMHMAVINNDQKIQYGANGIQLFMVNQDTLELLWELGLGNWGPSELAWLTEDTIMLRREYLAPNESEEVYISDEVLLVLSAKTPAIL